MKALLAVIAMTLLPASALAADVPAHCPPAHPHAAHAYHARAAHRHSGGMAVRHPGRPSVVNSDPTRSAPGYAGQEPDASAWADVTGRNGSPPFRAADQQRSFTMQCGYVYHRFFDEHGASLDRSVRVCN